VICLAITEPSAGSDVANLKTTAKKTADGKHYIVNGEKKWITNGVFADYFTVAVRTGGPGAAGVSLLLIERSAGITTTQMKCSGVWPSGTTYITFEDVKVRKKKKRAARVFGLSRATNERLWLCHVQSLNSSAAFLLFPLCRCPSRTSSARRTRDSSTSCQ
jgi:hypothetical protein